MLKYMYFRTVFHFLSEKKGEKVWILNICNEATTHEGERGQRTKTYVPADDRGKDQSIRIYKQNSRGFLGLK